VHSPWRIGCSSALSYAFANARVNVPGLALLAEQRTTAKSKKRFRQIFGKACCWAGLFFLGVKADDDCSRLDFPDVAKNFLILLA